MRCRFFVVAGTLFVLHAVLHAQAAGPQASPAIRAMLDQAMKLQDPSQQIEGFKKAIDAAKTARDVEGQAESEFDLGQLVRSDEAIAWYQAAVNDYKAAGDQENEGESLRLLGIAYSNLGNNAKALDCYHRAITVAQAAHSKKEEGRTLNNIGNTYVITGKRKQALDYYGSSLRVSREAGDKVTEGKVLLNIGNEFADLGKPKVALDYYAQARIAKRESGAKAGGESWALRMMGRVTAQLGDLGQGLAYLNQALALEQQYGDLTGQAYTYDELAEVHRRLGEYESSLDDGRHVHELAAKIGDRRLEDFSLNSMAAAQELLGKKQEALALYHEAIDLAKRIGDRSAEAVAQSDIGADYRDLGQRTQAIEAFQRALELQIELGERGNQAVALQNLGETYSDQHKWHEAIRYYNRAIPIAKEVDRKDLVAYALDNLASALAADNHPELAILVAKEGINTYQGMRKNILALPKAEQHSFANRVEPAYRRLASLLIKQGRLREAEKVMNLLKDEENVDYISREETPASGAEGRIEAVGQEGGWWAKYQQLQDQALKIDSEEFDLTQKSSSLRSSPSLNAEQKAELSKIDARLKTLDAQKDVIDKAADAYFDEVGKMASRAAGSIREEAEARVRQTGDELPSLLERIYHRTGEKVGAVYALASSDELDFLIVTYVGRAHLSVPLKSDELNAMISEFRKELMNPNADPRPQGEKLYHLVFERLIRQLQEGGCTRVVWCLDGTLRYVPIGALWDGRQYLIERGDFTMFDPLNLDRVASDAASTLHAAGFAATEGKGTDFAPLPGADAELKSVVKDDSQPGFTGVVPGRAWENKGFDEPNLVAAMKGGQFSLLHIATHFNVGKDFNSSDLLLGDGSLLSLKQFTDAGSHGRLGHLDLVCLSACDTAESFEDSAGAGGQFSSFVSLTLKDGASAVVASLWPVSDASTPVLMRRFYANWMANRGSGKADALRLAQLSLLHGDQSGSGGTRKSVNRQQGSVPIPFKSDAEHPFAHPYYWAPFILFGNWK